MFLYLSFIRNNEYEYTSNISAIELIIMVSLDKITGSFGKQRAAYLLRRTTFGLTSTHLRNSSDFTIDTALDELFQDDNMPERLSQVLTAHG
jgi:hypothetical protein